MKRLLTTVPAALCAPAALSPYRRRICKALMLALLFGPAGRIAAGQNQALIPDKPYYLAGDTVRIEYRLPPVEEGQRIRLVVEGRGDDRQTKALTRIGAHDLKRPGRGVIELRGRTDNDGPLRLSVDHPLLDDPPFIWIWVFSELDPWPEALSVVGGSRVRMADDFQVSVQRPAGTDEEPPRLLVRLVRPAFIVEGGAVDGEDHLDDEWLEPTESSTWFRAPPLPGQYEIRLLGAQPFTRL